MSFSDGNLRQATPEQVSRAFQITGELHPTLHNRTATAQFLERQVESGGLVSVGNLCLVNAQVVPTLLDFYAQMAERGRLEAALIGYGVKMSAGNVVRHSYVGRSTLAHARLVRGCQVYGESNVMNVNLSDTRLDHATLFNVVGSSGSNTVTGQLSAVDLAASGAQVMVASSDRSYRHLSIY